jgi:hypothetical protein
MLISFCLEIMLILMQHRRTVCAKRTMAQKSFCTYPMELLSHVGHVESRFSPLGYNVRVGAR